MTDRFDACLPLILKHEGGFVDHKDDPGGATCYGVTQAVYDAHRTGRGLPKRSVREIEPHEVAIIYERGYWDAARCDDMPKGLDYLHFDTAVNMGVGRAARFLQEALGVKVDGQIGPGTMGALAKAKPGALIRSISALRRAYYESRPHFSTFGKGWLRRLDDVTRKALAWSA